MGFKKRYIVRGIEKIQRRDDKGHFLPKARKYIVKTCPKVTYTRDIVNAKLFNSFAKANYAMYGISNMSDKLYDFDVIPINFILEEDEKR